MDSLRRALLNAIDDAPCSDRALAREAGLAHSTLIRIRDGTLHATPAVAAKIAAALERWGERCNTAAGRLHSEIGKRQNAGGKP